MRIQEMRSGLSHFRPKAETHVVNNGYDHEALEEDVLTLRPMAARAAREACDLQANSWSVVCFNGIEARGMRYDQAVQLMTELDSHGVSGLCIVTDAAAQRILG